MIRHIILYLTMAVMCGMLQSCLDRSSRIESNIADAEQAVADGRIEEAQSLCDVVDQDIDSEEITVNQLGRLSLVHMRLNEAYAHDDYDNVGRAVACYRAAYAVNADSAQVFYSECQLADLPYSMTLATIVKNIDNPAPWPEEEPDSIPVVQP